MKKKVISMMLLASLTSNITAYAVDGIESNELEGFNDETILEPYEKISKNNENLKKSVEENEYFQRKEVLDDVYGLESMKEIVQKTDKKYEIAIAHDNGEFEYLYSSDNIEEIKEEKLNLDVKNLVIISENKIVYSDYAIGRAVKHIDNKIAPITEITKIYPNSTTTNEYTYYNHGYIDDVPIIEYNNNRVKIQMSSYTGWVDQNVSNGNFEIVVTPINQIKNPSYFVNDNGILKHFISSDLLTEGRGNYIYLGQAPNYMENNKKYYSYDKEYFYDDLYKLIDDLKANTKMNSINKNKKYNSYYEYLSFRSKTSLTAQEIDLFINANTQTTSKLRNIGTALKTVENKFGVNAIALLGIAINESGWGMSKIAQEKNNIFGINAKDSSPGQSANYFDSIEKCINEFAEIWISKGYANPTDWRFNNAIIGNKKVGTNVRYASDPFWGEKATTHMFNIAKSDVGNLSIGEMKEKTVVYDDNLQKKYELKNIENYLVIKGKKNINNKNYYMVNSEFSNNGIYEWDNISLVEAEKVNIIWDNGSIDEEVKPEVNIGWKLENGKWYLYDENGFLIKGMIEKEGYKYYLDEVTGEMRTGWVIYNDEYYYFASSGEMKTGWINDGWTDYYLKSNGTIHKGWLDDGMYKYYLDNNGQLKRGWVQDNNEYYYFGSNGEMKTGWINDGWTDYYLKLNGTIHKGWLDDGMYKYYLDNNGQLKRGWVQDNNEYYYFGSNGEMKTGWINDGWTDYYLKSNGTIHKGWLDDGMYKYYLDNNGQMKRGWHKENQDWYYFGINGEMKTGWINDGYDDYYFLSDGKLKPPVDIVDLNLEFDFGLTGPEENNPQKLVLHHAAGDTTVINVHNFHRYTNKWAGIGYHFYIHKDGTIYKGRNEEWRGAHAAEIGPDDGDKTNDMNATSLGIAVQGDYSKAQMSKAQEDAVVKLGKYLVSKYGISTILRHGDPGVGHTSCPGKNYPFERIKGKILSNFVLGVYKSEYEE